MTLFTVSNKTWLNVEGTLNSWNRAKCSIASARGMTRGSTQLNGKSIGTRKRLACTRVSYANFARNTENRQMASEIIAYMREYKAKREADNAARIARGLPPLKTINSLTVAQAEERERKAAAKAAEREAKAA